MGIFSFIGNLFKPAADLIDNLHTSDEEKLTLRNEFAKVQAKANEHFLKLAESEMKMRQEIIKAEASSTHWLQGNWRPMCSIALILIVVLDSFSIVSASPELYTLATSFLGLYGAGRSIEKAASVIKLGK